MADACSHCSRVRSICIENVKRSAGSLIKAGVAPLVFLTIVHGIALAGDVKSAGRVGWRSILYFEVVSTIALMLGLRCVGCQTAPVSGAVPGWAPAEAAWADGHLPGEDANGIKPHTSGISMTKANAA